MIVKDYKPVLFDGAYKKGEWALDRYVAEGGYEAAKKVLAMKREAATNIKRTWVNHGRSRDWMGPDGEGRAFLRAATEVKTVWVPYGE